MDFFDPTDWQDLYKLNRFRQQEEANRLLRLQVVNQQRMSQGLQPLNSLPKTDFENAWDRLTGSIAALIGICILVFIGWIGFLFLKNIYDINKKKRDLQSSAENGAIESQYALGLAFYTGDTEGIDKNNGLAVFWLGKASDSGHAGSSCRLGDVYLEMGDLSKAYYRYELAAQQGNPVSQIVVGKAYLNGDHLAQDLDKADLWLQAALKEPITSNEARKLLDKLAEKRNILFLKEQEQLLQAVLPRFDSLQEKLHLFNNSFKEDGKLGSTQAVLLRNSAYTQPHVVTVSFFSEGVNEIEVRKSEHPNILSVYSKELYAGSYYLPSDEVYLLPGKIIRKQINDILGLQIRFPSLSDKLENDHRKWLEGARCRINYLTGELSRIDRIKESVAEVLAKLINEVPSQVQKNPAFSSKYLSLQHEISTLTYTQKKLEDDRNSLQALF